VRMNMHRCMNTHMCTCIHIREDEYTQVQTHRCNGIIVHTHCVCVRDCIHTHCVCVRECIHTNTCTKVHTEPPCAIHANNQKKKIHHITRAKIIFHSLGTHTHTHTQGGNVKTSAAGAGNQKCQVYVVGVGIYDEVGIIRRARIFCFR